MHVHSSARLGRNATVPLPVTTGQLTVHRTFDTEEHSLRERSGTTPEPAVQDEAKDSHESPADGIQGDYADHQECEHHQGRAALPVAMDPCAHKQGNADEKSDGGRELGRAGRAEADNRAISSSFGVSSRSQSSQRNERHFVAAFPGDRAFVTDP